MVAVAWSKADWKFQNKFGDQNKVAYADFVRVFQKVFWQLAWQIFIIRAAIFYLDPSLIELNRSYRSVVQSYRPPVLLTIFFPDFLSLQELVKYMEISLPRYGATILLVLLFFGSCLLAALATIAAFLTTLSYGRKRYLQ